MSSYIEAVKNNVQSVSDHLVEEYKGCDLRFAFVRYTDYDQPESTRTTWIDFTRFVTSILSPIYTRPLMQIRILINRLCVE